MHSGEFDAVVWMDCDTWFNNFDKRIEDVIAEGGDKDVTVARDHWDFKAPSVWSYGFVNSGVVIFKCNEDAERILLKWQNPNERAVYFKRRTCDLNDQPFLNYLLLFDEHSVEHSAIVGYEDLNYCPYMWNEDKSVGLSKVFIYHVGGKKRTEQRWLAKALPYLAITRQENGLL